nr:TetR/AcrR family transcriptional regulator [Candidatus Omnitrophota bacterium]HPT07265.1 TetR/AcrR family transcriptional regulator [Candidatus Omnitrophota bacterium]
MTTLSRKERDRQLRRSDILTAAEHLFALKGYYKATIRDIAKEAQYATGTVYLHFKDKYALYFALLEDKMKSLLSIVKDRIGQEPDAQKKLEIFVREGLGFFEKNQDFFRIFISERNELFSGRKILRSPIGLQLQEYTTSLIKEAQKEGVVSADFDPGQISEVFISIIKTILIKWLVDKEGKNENLVDLSDVVLKLFFYGVVRK